MLRHALSMTIQKPSKYRVYHYVGHGLMTFTIISVKGEYLVLKEDL